MVAELRSKPRKRSRQAYVTVWAALGTVAFAYMTASTVAPELVGEVIPIAHRESDDQAKRMLAEVETMRREVSKLRQELAAAQVAPAGPARIETAQAPPPLPPLPALPTAPVQLAPPDEPASGPGLSPRILAKAAERAPAKAQPPVASRDVAVPARTAEAEAARGQSGAGTAPVILNGTPSTDEAQNPIVTGSIPPDDARARAAAQPQAPKAAPAPKGPVGIEIGGADSLESLRLSWTVMNDQNGSLLGKLSPRYRLNTSGSGDPLALVAGPIATPEEATRICATLKAKGVKCRIGAYSGERL